MAASLTERIESFRTVLAPTFGRVVFRGDGRVPEGIGNSRAPIRLACTAIGRSPDIPAFVDPPLRPLRPTPRPDQRSCSCGRRGSLAPTSRELAVAPRRCKSRGIARLNSTWNLPGRLIAARRLGGCSPPAEGGLRSLTRAFEGSKLLDVSSVAREGETDAARPSTLQPLAGKVVLVTGGGRGIGRAIAQRVATEGASVVVADSGSSVSGAGEDVSVAPEAAAGIVAAGRAAVSFSEDIAASGGAERAVELAVSTFGRIDGLVCCAGNFRSSALMDLDDAHWDDVIRVHLRGQFACLRAVARRMRQQPEGGSIILFSSVGGVIGSADQVAYSSAKAGVLGLLVSASRALQPHNIRVNAVLPGASTRMTDALWAQASTADVNGISVPSDSVAGTWRDPANVAPFVSLLLSDASQMLTSQAYAVVGYQVTQVLLPRWGRTIRSDGPWSTEELAHKVQSEFEPLVPLGLDAWPPS